MLKIGKNKEGKTEHRGKKWAKKRRLEKKGLNEVEKRSAGIIGFRGGRRGLGV